MTKVTVDHELKINVFGELNIGDIFTRVSDGGLYMKIDKSDEYNNSIILGGSSTWKVNTNESVITRNVEIVVK